MQVKPLFLLFISIPLTGGQYIRDVYVEGMLNCFHLGLKTTEEVKPSLHNRCYFFAFSRQAKASAKRARSARHGTRQGKLTWDKTATFFFVKKVVLRL